MFDLFSKKSANIIHVDEKNKVEVSEDFSSVDHANLALLHLTSTKVVIDKDYNDEGGLEVKTLESTKKSRFWGEHDYLIYPTNKIK